MFQSILSIFIPDPGDPNVLIKLPRKYNLVGDNGIFRLVRRTQAQRDEELENPIFEIYPSTFWDCVLSFSNYMLEFDHFDLWFHARCDRAIRNDDDPRVVMAETVRFIQRNFIISPKTFHVNLLKIFRSIYDENERSNQRHRYVFHEDHPLGKFENCIVVPMLVFHWRTLLYYRESRLKSAARKVIFRLLNRDDHLVFDRIYALIRKPVNIGFIPEELKTLPCNRLEWPVDLDSHAFGSLSLGD